REDSHGGGWGTGSLTILPAARFVLRYVDIHIGGGVQVTPSINDGWGRFLSRPGTTQATIAFIFVVTVLLRLPNFTESLWYDEVYYSTRFVANTLSKLWEQTLSEPPAPLYRLALYGWVGLFGENEIAVRMPSLICGIAAIFLTYALATNYGQTPAASLAALFLCFSSTHIWYSQEATP